MSSSERALRVLFSIDSMHMGGTELNAVRTAELLLTRGIEVEVLCLKSEGPLSSRYAGAGIPVRYLGLRNLYGAGALRAGHGVVQWLKQRNFDVVHSHDMYSNIFLTACVRLGARGKVIASQRWWANLPERRYHVGNLLAFRYADAVLANSPSVATLVATQLGVSLAKIAVIPNFLSESSYFLMPREERARRLNDMMVPAQALVIGCVARLTKVKDHASLLHAFALVHAQHSSTHLLLIGEGPERQALVDLVEVLGLTSAVTFGGFIDNTLNLHGLLDVSVLASTSEGFPNSVIEAMAVGRPVVATRVGGTEDAIEDGVSGLLVPPSSPALLADALGRVVVDEALRLRIGDAARAVARQRYGHDTVLPKLVELYHALSDAHDD